VTQDSSTIKMNNLVLKGKEVNVTAKDLSVNSLTYTADNGYLQLSHIVSQADSTVTMKVFGDVIIQSTKDLNIIAKTDSQAFCFSAPTVTLNSQNNKCAIQKDTSTWVNNRTIGCQADYNLCQASCSSPQKFTVTSPQGNIYGNIISAVGKAVASTSAVENGWTFTQGIRLSDYASSQVGNFSQLVNDTTKNSPMIILNLGSLESRSSQFTKWVITANPAYAYMKPWWMSIFSATILTNYQ
jgi:hypothetical protein